MSIQSMIIKDGAGNTKSLTVESSSYGFIPYHQITSSDSNPVYITASSANPISVTGSLLIGNSSLNITSSVSSPVYISAAPVTTVAQNSVISFDYTTVASGTFVIAANNTSRKGLTVFNPGPNNLYLALSTAGGATNGFTLTNTASAPSLYSFIIYPSGTYTADSTTVAVYHGGYFISGSTSTGVFISAIS